MIKKALVIHVMLFMLMLSQFAFAEGTVWETFEDARIIHNTTPYGTNTGFGTITSDYELYPDDDDVFFNLNRGLFLTNINAAAWAVDSQTGGVVEDGFAQTFVVENTGRYELEIRGHVDSGKLRAITFPAAGDGEHSISNSFSLWVTGSILSNTTAIANDTINLHSFSEDIWPTEDNELLKEVIEEMPLGGEYLAYILYDAASAKTFSRTDFVLSINSHLEAGKTYEWSFVSSSNALATIGGLFWGGNISSVQMRYEIDRVSVIYSPIIISASAGPRGTIYPRDSAPIVLGGSKTFDTVPDIGYEVDLWLTEEGGSVLQNGGTSYTVSNIQGDTTIHVTFKAKTHSEESKTVSLSPWYDTDANEQYPNNVYYNSIFLHADTLGGYDTYAYMGFRLNDIPKGSVVSEAALNIWGRGEGSLYIYKVTGTVSGGNNDSISWENRPNYSSSYLRFMVGESPSDGSFYHHQEKIKNYIQQQVDAADDCELVLKPISVNTYVTFASDEYSSDNSVRPKLVITYIPPPPPDLIITDLYPEPSPSDNTYHVGQSIDWHVTVKNNGSGPSDSSSVGYYLGTSSTDFSNPINSDSTDALNSGESDTDNDAYTFAASDVGQRYLICKADYEDGVEESSEDNNTRVYGPFNVAEKVNTPSISPNGGTFIGSTQVTIDCATPSATIRYTTNGTTPTSSSTLYASPFTVSSSCTVKACGFKSGYTDSDVASASFTINPTPKVATPIILPNGGTFTSLPTITLSCSTQDTTIRYTIDGSTPTSTSTQYTEALTIISSTYTIRARGFKSGYTDSDTASAIFTITSEEIPELSVIPDSRAVNANSGTTTFTVNNTGSGTMSWTASVISGENWLSITSDSSGTNSGTISVGFSANTSGFSRTGTIRVTASGADGTSKDVTVMQSSPGTIDTDNDGLPDDWENQHFGNLATADNTTDTDGDGLLDKDEYTYKTNPNNTDSDGDGDSDGDEVLYGSDPTLITDTLDSHRPDTPVILQVSGDVPLCGQIFDVDGFGDPELLQGDYLSASEWQISTDQNFNQNNIILQRILERRSGAADDAIEHRQLLMPQAVLVKANTYWIRTRHRDSKGLWSLWAVPVAFTTVADNPNDLDNNDIDDACQVPGYTDTNNNGADDSQENIYALYDAEKGNTIGIHADSGVLGSLDAMPSNEIPAELMPEHPMPSGLFSFRIDGLTVDANNPATVDITFYFSEPLPSNTKWYKYDPANYTVSDFTSNLTINGNRAVLTLTDGGPGDDDGVVNGIIVDPSGAAVPSTSEPTTPSNSGGGGGGGGGGGCFIATAAFGSYMEPSVTILRQFRDVYLLPHRLSQLFIETYYRYSPPIADFIAEHNSLRAAVRLGLAPIIGMCWIVLNYGLLFASLIMMLFVTILFGSTVLILRRRKTET